MPLKRRIAWGLFLLALVVACAVAAIGVFPIRPTSDQVLKQARLELARGNHQQAETLAVQAAASRDPSPWSLIVAAEAALKTNRYADALGYYQQVPRHVTVVAASADFGEAEMLCHLGRLSESEARLRKLLELDPNNRLAHYRLAFLLNITGRRWDAQTHLLFLVSNQAAEVEHLLLLGNSQRQIEDRALLDATAKLNPADPLPILGAARLALSLNHRDEARALLKSFLERSPGEPEAQVRWGQLLLDDTDSGPFVAWSAGISRRTEQHPDAWMLRGLFAQRSRQPQMAARCFWEALRRDPQHQAACHQLGQALAELNRLEEAAVCAERAQWMQQLTVAIDDLFHHRDHVESMRRAALLSLQLGRLWEAASWSSIALSSDDRLDWATQILQQVSPILHPALPQTAPQFDPITRLDLSSYPLPAWSAPSANAANSANLPVADIRFIDRAAELGIDFQYENASDDSTQGARIFETTGGGVAVLDYDLDGWPDLYLTQGGRDSNLSDTADTAWIDRLYRNGSGRRFDDATIAAGLGDRGFSQGVTVGDFDNDGFPDLYVANFGQNRLYLNQGDGSFRDITDEAGLRESIWTTSCLMADLNGDGFPDIYDVNYCAGSSLLTRICEKQGVIRSCSPRAFDPAPDRVWQNMGDGSVRDVTVPCGINVPNGYGLGIVAMDLEEQGRLSLFIANDEVSNFLFVNQSTQPGASLAFHESGLISGAALDADGKAQACMGVAAGDADGDNLIDLFVTNFYMESNTLYRQIHPGQFVDATRSAGLRDPSYAMLGFGTQFLDMDLDGWEDLVLTNGHIDDLTSIGEPWKMPTQVLWNRGRGQFVEIPASKLGPFFEKGHLGRGLARVDWNRDGRDDFAVSHLLEPVGLLTNESTATGHSLAVALRGTRCSRDAIGAVVEIEVGGRRVVKQLTAGDGYHASNERLIRFGLGGANQVARLTIRWPGGDSQSWLSVGADRTVLAIEGSSRLIEMPR